MYAKTKNDLTGKYLYLSLDEKESKEICLDISSKISLAKAFSEREMVYSDIESVIKTIISKGTEAMSKGKTLQYLVLSPEYIYLDMYSLKVTIIEFPCEHGYFIQYLQDLAEFLIERCDHTDRRAVLLSYRFYMKVFNMDMSFARLF